MAVNGKALAVTSIGVLFIWSGIKGWSLLGTVQDLVTGATPSGANVNPLGTGATSSLPGNSAGGGSIADVAKQYEGHAYRFGGAPGKDGSQPWDCSSFANFVLGVRLGLRIPGYAAGAYDGSVHGPVTGQWGIWPGISHVSRASVQAGDLIVWTGHMGIALDNATMISALNANVGTKITPIEGNGNGPILCYGRYGYSGAVAS